MGASDRISQINSVVGSRLKELRLLHGMTQQDLSRKLNLTYQQIQKYEVGKNAIGAGRLYLISQVLEVSPLYFFDDLSIPTASIQESRAASLKLAAQINTIQNLHIRKGIEALILATVKAEPH